MKRCVYGPYIHLLLHDGLFVPRLADPRKLEDLARAMERHPDRSNAARMDRALSVQVERERAGTGAWYEFFPRSTAGGSGEQFDRPAR